LTEHNQNIKVALVNIKHTQEKTTITQLEVTHTHTHTHTHRERERERERERSLIAFYNMRPGKGSDIFYARRLGDAALYNTLRQRVID